MNTASTVGDWLMEWVLSGLTLTTSPELPLESMHAEPPAEDHIFGKSRRVTKVVWIRGLTAKPTGEPPVEEDATGQEKKYSQMPSIYVLHIKSVPRMLKRQWGESLTSDEQSLVTPT